MAAVLVGLSVYFSLCLCKCFSVTVVIYVRAAILILSNKSDLIFIHFVQYRPTSNFSMSS